jgi:hypothetical protein
VNPALMDMILLTGQIDMEGITTLMLCVMLVNMCVDTLDVTKILGPGMGPCSAVIKLGLRMI